MEPEYLPHIRPGSVNRVSPEELKLAWSRRQFDRDASLKVFSEGVFSFTKREMMSILNASFDEITEFLSPRLPAEFVDKLKPLVPDTRHWKLRDPTIGDAKALDKIIGELRAVGWYQIEIADALGITRQILIRINASGVVQPDEETRSVLPIPMRVRFYSLRSVPDYIFKTGKKGRAPWSLLTEEAKTKLIALEAAVVEAYGAQFVNVQLPTAEYRENIRRAELTLVLYSQRVSDEQRVSLTSMSQSLRPRNPYYLARMARRLGIDVEIPPSVAETSPVLAEWRPSRTIGARAFDDFQKQVSAKSRRTSEAPAATPRKEVPGPETD